MGQLPDREVESTVGMVPQLRLSDGLMGPNARNQEVL